MQKRVENILSSRTLLAGLLLTIFGWYYINISLFLHYHVVDGVTIVHSHISGSEHANDSTNSDAHSENELTLLHAIGKYNVESPVYQLSIEAIYIELHKLYIENKISIVESTPHHCITLRGPPAPSHIG